MVMTLVGLLAAIQAPLPQDTVHYRVTLAAPDSPRLHVEARYPTVRGRLWMHPHWASHLPRGWASLVDGLTASGPDSRPVTLTPVDTSSWTVSGSGPFTVSYDIDLAFTRSPWPPGNEQGGSRWPDALYLVGRAPFIIADTASAVEVSFQLPPGWSATVPWQRGRGRETFTVPNAASLLGNPIILGRNAGLAATRGPFTLTLALPGASLAERAQVEAVLAPVVDQLVPLFPGTPSSRHLMVYFRSYEDDGEGFLNGAAFTTSAPITREGLPIWGNFLAHEMLHFWLGQRLRSNPRADGEWFSEGGTEYLSNIALLRAHVIDRATFLQKAARHVGNYAYFRWAPAFATVSIATAGRNKGRDRFGVYDGGWVASLCLDSKIREHSDGRHSFESLVTRLWQKHGATSTPWTWDDLVGEATALAGIDLRPMLDSAVAGVTPLRVDDCLRALGVVHYGKPYAAESWLFDDPAASPAARARREAWYRGR